jgi:hypothetical protein
MIVTAAKRIQVELPQNSFDRLQRLKSSVEATSYTEVFKDALRLYEYLVEESEKGSKFIVKNKEGDLVEIKIFS